MRFLKWKCIQVFSRRVYLPLSDFKGEDVEVGEDDVPVECVDVCVAVVVSSGNSESTLPLFKL